MREYELGGRKIGYKLNRIVNGYKFILIGYKICSNKGSTVARVRFEETVNVIDLDSTWNDLTCLRE